MAQFIVGGVAFNSKKHAKDYIQGIVVEHKGRPPFDDKILRDLIEERHPNAGYVVGVGITAFVVSQRKEWGDNWGFDVIRIDGSREPFSWVKCLTPPKHSAMVVKAGRIAVKQQVIGYRDEHLSPHSVCEMTGVPLAGERVHVDHIKHFSVLFSDWLDSIDLTFDDIAVEDMGDGNTGHVRFEDEDLWDSWQQYHKMFASLRLVTQDYNLRRRD